MPFNPGGLLGSLFAGGGYRPLGTPTINSPQSQADIQNNQRTNYTGSFQGGAGGPYGTVGDPNNKNGQGPELGPTTPTSGPVPLGGWSQLGGHTNDLTGYITSPGASQPTAPTLGTPYHMGSSWQTNPSAPYVAPQPGPQAAPHAREPGATQPMLGQWGGGGWNTGSGAPASMQPMWLGSMNGGQNWSQAPQYNATAPKPGQNGSSVGGVNWTQTANQDPDSMTWRQH